MQSEYHDAHPITLGGKKHFLRISTRSLRYAKKYHNEHVDISTLQDGLRDPSLFAQLVWVGLLHEDKTLKEDDVYDLMDKETAANVKKIQLAAGGALMEAIEEMKNFGEGVAAPMANSEDPSLTSSTS